MFSIDLNPYLLGHAIYSALITYLITGVVLDANDRWLRLQASLYEHLKGVYNGVNCRMQCCILDELLKQILSVMCRVLC